MKSIDIFSFVLKAFSNEVSVCKLWPCGSTARLLGWDLEETKPRRYISGVISRFPVLSWSSNFFHSSYKYKIMLDFNYIEQQTNIKIYEPWKVLVTVVIIPINMLGLST
jgi:hypothetical protein